LPKAIDEQQVECGVVLTQLLQETHDAEEPPFIASNEIVLNMEPVCRSVGVGDAGDGVANTGFIGVDPQPIPTGFTLDVDLSSVELELMPEYETAFGDERAEDSTDDLLVSELSNRDNALL
jgi:hypothetical protein